MVGAVFGGVGDGEAEGGIDGVKADAAFGWGGWWWGVCGGAVDEDELAGAGKTDVGRVVDWIAVIVGQSGGSAGAFDFDKIKTGGVEIDVFVFEVLGVGGL